MTGKRNAEYGRWFWRLRRPLCAWAALLALALATGSEFGCGGEEPHRVSGYPVVGVYVSDLEDPGTLRAAREDARRRAEQRVEEWSLS